MIVKIIQVYTNNIVFTLKIGLWSYKIAISYLLFPFFMLFFHVFEIILFYFFAFLYRIMYALNYASVVKKMSVNEIRDLVYENYFKQIGFHKENSYYSMRRLKKNCCCFQLN